MFAKIGAIFAASFLSSIAFAQAGETGAGAGDLDEPPRFQVNRVTFHGETSPSETLSSLLASLEPSHGLAESAEEISASMSLEAALRESIWRHRVAYELEALLK